MNNRIDFNKEIYDFIIKYFKEHMIVPTVREVRDNTRYKSVESVHKFMQRLVSTGHLKQVSGRYTLPEAKIRELLKEKE